MTSLKLSVHPERLGENGEHKCVGDVGVLILMPMIRCVEIIGLGRVCAVCRGFALQWFFIFTAFTCIVSIINPRCRSSEGYGSCLVSVSVSLSVTTFSAQRDNKTAIPTGSSLHRLH